MSHRHVTGAFPSAVAHPEPGRGRRLITHEEAVALAELAIKMVTVPTLSVNISHRTTAVAKIVNNRYLRCFDLDQLALDFETRVGSDIHVMVGTNVRDAATLQAVIRHAEMKRAPLIRPEDRGEDDADDPARRAMEARSYVPVTLWHDSTAQAIDTVRGDTLASMVATMREASGAGERAFRLAATVALSAQARLCHYAYGRSAWAEATDSEVTVSARTTDGRASGWSGQVARDWAQIRPLHVVTEAVDIANRSRNPVRMEPGRYTAILGHAAVGQLVHQMHANFMAELNRGQGDRPFGLTNSPDGKKLRLGQRVFDARISMWTDPNDPMGGDYPFFVEDGFPSGKEIWIEHGVLRALAYGQPDALSNGKIPVKAPVSMHVGVTGPTSTIAEMIANCERGIYVNRFSNVHITDDATGSLIGNTRDGCFFVKDGKIQHPITNFRFFESPFFVFNRILAVGTPERVPFGFVPPERSSYSYMSEIGDWPLPPVIAPPLMVSDFNFSALSDAV